MHTWTTLIFFVVQHLHSFLMRQKNNNQQLSVEIKFKILIAKEMYLARDVKDERRSKAADGDRGETPRAAKTGGFIELEVYTPLFGIHPINNLLNRKKLLDLATWVHVWTHIWTGWGSAGEKGYQKACQRSPVSEHVLGTIKNLKCRTLSYGRINGAV